MKEFTWDDILGCIRRRAYNDAARRIQETGIVLTWDEAYELGEEALDWATRRLVLEKTSSDIGVYLMPRAN